MTYRLKNKTSTSQKTRVKNKTGCDPLNFYISYLTRSHNENEKKKKNSEIYITTQLSLTMFKPVSTFTYFEKKTQFKFALTRFSALSKIERSLVQWTWKIQGAQHMICMEKLRFSSHPRAIVRHHGPLGSTRIQPWLQKKNFTHFVWSRNWTMSIDSCNLQGKQEMIYQ